MEQLRGVLSIVVDIPPVWSVTMAGLALVSCFAVSRPASGGLEIDFAVSGITLGALALIWLPALLRLLALTGGRLKAAGVEASSAGLFGSPEDLIDRLASIRTVTEEAERKAPEASEALRGVEIEVDQIASEYLGQAGAVNGPAIEALARAYEELREKLPPGDHRTNRMTQIVNEARVRAQADPAEAERRIPSLLRSKRSGERIVGLAFTQDAPTTRVYREVMELIRHSATAFEMYHALLALRQIAPRLEPDERARAVDILLAERQDPRGIGVDDDPYLPAMVDHLVDVLRG